MMEQYQYYLSLLGEIAETLAQLTVTAQEKTAAVRQSDLTALDETIKKEQALALALRGFELKRAQLLSQLGLDGAPLSALVDRYPPSLRLTAQQAVETLQTQYQLYRSAADAARSTLELNLHMIEKYLEEAEAITAGPGYAPHAEAAPPASLRSDFRV